MHIICGCKFKIYSGSNRWCQTKELGQNSELHSMRKRIIGGYEGDEDRVNELGVGGGGGGCAAGRRFEFQRYFYWVSAETLKTAPLKSTLHPTISRFCK